MKLNKFEEGYLDRIPRRNEENTLGSCIKEIMKEISTEVTIKIHYAVSRINTIVKCLRTVCVARTAQEPKTSYSGETGFRKFSVRVSTHLEIMDGHRFSNFKRDFPASLRSNSNTHQISQTLMPKKGNKIK